MDIKEVQLQWFESYFDKKNFWCAFKNETMQNKGLAEKLRKRTIRKFENEKYTHLLQIIFGLLIQLICNC